MDGFSKCSVYTFFAFYYNIYHMAFLHIVGITKSILEYLKMVLLPLQCYELRNLNKLILHNYVFVFNTEWLKAECCMLLKINNLWCKEVILFLYFYYS